MTLYAKMAATTMYFYSKVAPFKNRHEASGDRPLGLSKGKAKIVTMKLKQEKTESIIRELSFYMLSLVFWLLNKEVK